jgi:hypothetical protein
MRKKRTFRRSPIAYCLLPIASTYPGMQGRPFFVFSALYTLSASEKRGAARISRKVYNYYKKKQKNPEKPS